MKENNNLMALLLVGGLGTRLRPVIASVPKPLARVGGSSFLDLLIEQLRNQGFRSLVMCTGYMSEQIESEFGAGSGKGVNIEYSRELTPMGTGGAVKLAEPLLEGAEEFLVMNGDSFIEVDFQHLVAFHRAHQGIATLAVAPVEDSARYGTVQVDQSGRVNGFSEKTGKAEPGIINAGVYVFNRALLSYIPRGISSLERDVFPQVLSKGVFALEQPGMFIDIGTPEDYATAQQLSARLKESVAVLTERPMNEGKRG